MEMTHVATRLGAPLSAVLTIDDLDILETSGGLVLLATSRASNMVTSYTVSAGGTSYSAATEVAEVDDRLGGAALEQLVVGGTATVFSAVGTGGDIATYRLSGGSLVDSGLTLEGTHLDRSISAFAEITIGTQTYVYTSNLGERGVGCYQLQANGQLDNFRDPGAMMPDGGNDISALMTLEVGSDAFLLTTSAMNNHISSYQINGAGGLQYRGSLGAAQGLSLSSPQAMTSVTLGGNTYVFVASAVSSSLSVLRIEEDGALRQIDHLTDDLFSRFQGVSTLKAVEADGRAYVLAGGADGGLSLFQLLPHGELLMLDGIEDQTSMSLGQVAAIEMRHLGDELHIFAGSSNEAAVTHLVAALPEVGQERTAGIGETLIGSADSDILYDAAGDEELYGAGGDDILIGGQGSDRFDGGDGRDIFIVAGDGNDDRIVGFVPGVDQIDLTGWSGLYGVDSLSFASVAGGGRISFGGERLIVRSADGETLSVSELQAAVMQNFTRSTLFDAALDPLIEGTSGDDQIQGSAGDDILRGLAGADAMNGGAGTDAVSYEDSRGSLRVDLMYPHINTNVAAGDTYESIENLIGSQGFDNLRGTLGDNLIVGGRNVDYIFGRRGNDTLEGGIGDDVLFGGVGQDVLIGGEHRDRAQYSESLTAIIADLAVPGNNTGEAAGDSYSGIEDLAGGYYADQLRGDRYDNRLFGREGADRLLGRDGDDYLNGGAHGDWLDGEAGNDVLRGGTHADTFVFNAGQDRIEDFNFAHLDRIALDRAALGVGNRSGAETIADFGEIEGGLAVLDFGDGNQLTIESLTSLDGLADSLIFI